VLTFWELLLVLSLVIQVMKMGPVGVPKMLAPSCFPVLCNCPENWRFHSYQGRRRNWSSFGSAVL